MGVRARVLGVAAIATIASLAGVTSASAVVKDFAPDAQARDFNGGPGGWTFSTEYGGLCIPAITCYTAGSEHVSNGGPTGAGDGFLRTDLFTIANAVTETNAILTSPSFKYSGVNGNVPKQITFNMDRRTDLGGLLPVIADNATYTVKLVELGGTGTTIVDSTSMEGAEDAWTSIPTVTIGKDDLAIGSTYQIQIISTFAAGVTVLGLGTADYDNVVLQIRGGGGGGGGGGNAGSGGGFTTAIRNLIGTATHKGNKLLVPVGCPRFVAPAKCKLAVQAKLKKTGPAATKTKKLNLGAGKKKIAKLKIKGKYREAISKKKKVTVRVRASAGGKKRTVIKRVRVRHG